MLLTNLSSPDVHRSIKPVILGVCGDLALAVQNKFEPYMIHVLPILQSAQQLCISNQGSGERGSVNKWMCGYACSNHVQSVPCWLQPSPRASLSNSISRALRFAE